MSDRLAYRASEAAEALGLSTNFVRQLIREGEIPAARVGRAVVIRKEDLEGYLADLVKPTPTVENFSSESVP